MSRKRTLYLSELLLRHIPKAYQQVRIYNYDGSKTYFESKINNLFYIDEVPKELLDKQVAEWEAYNHFINIYLE